MNTLKINMPDDTVEKPKKQPGKKDNPSKQKEPAPSPLPSADPPEIKPGKPVPKVKPKEPEKRPAGPVEDDATYPQEFKSKEKLRKEAEKIREAEHLD